MKGWCPVHDRVYETSDGLCPRCGSALVDAADDAAQAPGPTPIVISAEPQHEAEPPDRIAGWSLPSSRTVIAAAAVAVAFVVGLAFPRGGTRDAQPASGTHEVRSEYTLGVNARDAGVVLRLESFSQRGTNVVARFTVPGDTIAIGRIRSVELVLQNGDRTIAQPTIGVRTTVSGFIAEGNVLDAPTVPVTAIGVASLLLDSTGGGTMTLDLRSVWPATRTTEPRAHHATGTLRLSDGRTLRLTGLVGWVGRIDARFAASDVPRGWIYNDEFTLVSLGSTTRSNVNPLDGSVDVSFVGVPAVAQRAQLRVRCVDLTIQGFGGWLWRFVG